jgi:HEAT repeat protein
LADAEADRAFASLCDLLATPAQGVALAKNKLQPTAKIDPKIVEALLHQLGSEQFPVRDKATRELVRIGHGALSELDEAAAGKRGTLEHQRRLTEILDRLRSWPQSAHGVRVHRLIEGLGRIGSPAARQELQRLADGAAGSPQTEAAHAALRLLK